ncbi:hypothetical protein MWU75_12480 [Ornithinimicrobium sp. F0845]|uniref:hypothetical protein n=1 Tax=Ornithinimicrobium sp. F0845 TaxID=2926412 RepID=UPI001FF65CE7|nr:hypothetical protein [Ornithinimicrobium sp. F0845]MCK0112957.1 hypothetical protein [Ornithinimicrobium sp. F0845]
MTAPRTALITTVRRQYDELVDQVSGFSLGVDVPDYHVVVGLADRAVTQGRLPITSDRWETLIAGLPTVKQQLPTAQALHLGIETAVEAGAELLVLVDVTCIPGPRFLEQVLDHLRQHPTDGTPTLWTSMVQRLPEAPPQGYEFTRLDEWSQSEHHPGPLPPGLGDTPLDPDRFSSPVLIITAEDLASVGGLCPEYVGGLGHDSDLAAAVAAAGGQVRLVPGATAYRRHLPPEAPDALQVAVATRDAHLYRERWGRAPGAPWFTDLVEAGRIPPEVDLAS